MPGYKPSLSASSPPCLQGMTLEKKEARAEKEEAEKYQKFQQELVSYSLRLGLKCRKFYHGTNPFLSSYGNAYCLCACTHGSR